MTVIASTIGRSNLLLRNIYSYNTRLLRRGASAPLLAMTLVILGCGGFGLIAQPVPTSTIEPTWIGSPLPTPFQPATATQTFLATEAFTPSTTSSPTFTVTPSPTSTPEFIFQGPGNVTVPILLYHHIGISLKGSSYYISREEFDKQMALLYAWGYKTIKVEQLVEAINHGAQLPVKPIILTFDDGGETVYTDALPIMQPYGFTGTDYIVYNYIGAGLFMDRDQIRGLHEAGWEIGSHSVSHIELPTRPGKQMDEIVSSRWRLESYLDMPIRSFAYPFGAYDKDSLYFVHYAGYIAAMGLGDESVQGKENLFYLYRQSITAETSLGSFAQLLPWKP